MSIYSRYLLGQIARPMITAILVALIALLAERTLRVIDLVVGWRGSLFVVFEMLGYLIPHYMGLALPVAFFLGILLTFSRLSREGELAAMNASGAGLPQLLRPILAASLVLAVTVAILVSLLQPYARYAYRAATYALTNASFTTLLQDGLFTTLGDTTYMVDHISGDKREMTGVFLYQGGAGKDAITITAASGEAERQGPTEPIILRLHNGLQQLVPAEDGAATGSGGTPVIVRFRNFETALADPAEDFRPRGEDEREMTLLELWNASDNLPPGVDPWEISSELYGRLVRILILPILPLMAIPLAIDRVRGQRSYGLVLGLAMLIAFHQVLQMGEALADNNKVPAWAGLWLPFAVFTAISIAMFVRAARRVPDPRLGIWLDRQFDRLGRFLPKRRGTAAARA
ncbi:MAG: LptF/LptG family permease [Geminicoccaceae bacterium]